jgi:ABC-type nitrate/sulfonate/bicarbonate transport system permease component
MTSLLTPRPDAAADGPPRRRSVARRVEPGRATRLALGAAGIAAVLALWEIASRAGWIDPLVASSPVGVAEGARDLMERGALMPALGSTVRLFLVGFGISLAAGLVIGALTGWYRRLDAVVDPWVSILYASPRIAFLPLIAVWFGPGFTGQVVVVVLIAVFPIIINVAAGVQAIDRDHLRMAQSFMASNRDVLVRIALPGAVPAIASGIRQGMMQGLLGVVVAEYFLGNTGIGGLIFQAGLMLRTGEALFGAVLFAVAALVLSAGLKRVESNLDRWRTS